MASLIPKNRVLVNFADVAPSPSKDYCQILVTLDDIIFRLWKITMRTDARSSPSEVKDTYEDFLYDDRTQGEVHRVFGKPMLDYVKNLAHGKIDYLPRLPRVILLKIVYYLDLEDIARLSLVSKLFWELCRCDDLWQMLYFDHSETSITTELNSLAEAIGWRKLYFTNKLQLQVQLRRHTSSRAEMIDLENDEHVFVTEDGDNASVADSELALLEDLPTDRDTNTPYEGEKSYVVPSTPSQVYIESIEQ